VDGQDSGETTPVTALKLSAGEHKLTLVNPEFKIKETVSVTIKAGETQTVVRQFNVGPH
jgi:hypothetical protein